MRYEDIVNRIRERLLEKTDIATFKPGTIAREIIEAYVVESSDAYNYLDARFTQSLISTATGDFLTQLGNLVGIVRNTSQLAYGEITFYIDPRLGKVLDDLKDILIENEAIELGQDIVFQKGTRILSINGEIEYTTTEDVILTDNETVVPIIARTGGSFGNAGVGELSTYNAVNDSHLFPVFDFILVKNNSAIDNGEDIEIDDNYRFRIVNGFAGHARANEIAVRLATLSVPGVSDVYIRNYEHGIGTFAVYVISESPIVSEGILSAVQEVVNQVVAIGIRGIVTHPDYEAVHICIELIFQPIATPGERDSIVEGVRDVVINYINNLAVSEDLVLKEIIAMVMNYSDLLRNMEFTSFGRGEYNVKTGTIIDYKVLLLNDQSVDISTKWITNSKLMEICVVG